MPSLLRVKTGVERQDHSEDQEMLPWRETRNSRAHVAVIKKSATWSARIVPAVLKPYNGIGLPIGNSVFERASHSFDGLREHGPAAIAVPSDLSPYGRATLLVEYPMHRQLSGHKRRARIST